MGLFDRVAGAVSGQQESGQPGMLESVMKLVNDPQNGGLSGLIQSFRDHGLGDKVSSWIGTGENQAISGEQMQNALGNERVQQIASQLGVSTENASQGLAGLLPQVIDKLTPGGGIPEGGLVAQGLSMFGLGSQPTGGEDAAPGEGATDEVAASEYETAAEQEIAASGEESDEDAVDPNRAL